MILKAFQTLRDRLVVFRRYAMERELLAKLEPFATGLSIVVVLALVSVGIWLVWTVPHWQVEQYVDLNHEMTLPKKLELEDAFRKTIAQIVLGAFGLLILYFTWRRARAGDATVRIMEQAHITDRFTKAIEQLGKTDGAIPNIEIRLGAIYALERIAIDSPRDHWSVMEILTAYVRQNAPYDPARPYVDGEKPRTEIQAILTVLGRRKTGPKREPPHRRAYLDLMKTRLCGARLVDANLQGADLEQADLRGALLQYAKLQRAALMEANLERAILRKANLAGAFFREAKLGQAEVDYADISEAQDLTTRQIQSAEKWNVAHYSVAFRAELGLT